MSLISWMRKKFPSVSYSVVTGFAYGANAHAAAKIVEYRITVDKAINVAQLPSNSSFEQFKEVLKNSIGLPTVDSLKIRYKVSSATARAPTGPALLLQDLSSYEEMLAEFEKAYGKYEAALKNPKASEKAREKPRVWLTDARDKDEKKASTYENTKKYTNAGSSAML